MSPETEALLRQATFAQVAYLTLDPSMSKPSYRDEVKKELPTDEATNFSETWTVKAQFSDVTGVSATVFADKTGNTYLAIRGTEPSLTDFLADGALALGVPKRLSQ